MFVGTIHAIESIKLESKSKRRWNVEEQNQSGNRVPRSLKANRDEVLLRSKSVIKIR